MHNPSEIATSTSVVRESPGEHLVGRLTRGLRRRYLTALVAVATLAVLHQLVVQPSLVRLNLYAPVINVAGRQRMLSQRLTKSALAIQAKPERESRFVELEETLGAWSRAHRGLQFGDGELDLPGTSSPAILAAFAELEPHFRAMLDAGRRIVARGGDGQGVDVAADPTNDADVETILEHEARYLPVMDRIVGLFEHEARDQVSGLRAAGFVIVGAILVLLGLVGWFVVLPASNVIDGQISKLEASETRYRSLVERMTDGLAVFRSGGVLEYANDRLCSMLGRSRGELVGHTFTAFASDEDRPRLLTHLENLTNDVDQGVVEIDWNVPMPGRCCTLVALGRMPAEPLTNFDDAASELGDEPRDETGTATPHVYFAVVTDISDRKRGEEALRDARDALEERVTERTGQLVAANERLECEIAERRVAEERSRTLQHQLAHASRVTAIGELATGLAHEINQPLGAIVMYVETIELLLDRDDPDVDLARTAIAHTRSAAVRAGKIIRRMRKFVQGRRQELQFVDPNDLVADVLELCRPEARRADVVVETELGDLPKVRVDGLGIQQVVVNIVQNAIQAMLQVPRDERRLLVSTEVDNGVVRLSFADNGPGFSSDPEEFFEPFRSTREEGLGMGLPISRSIVREHGGDLFSAARPGGGAVVGFTLRVPEMQLKEDEHVLV